MVYYTDNEVDNPIKMSIPLKEGNFNEFISVFPGIIPLEKGEEYSLYFEVFDNDGIRGPKKSKSEIFSFKNKSDNEIKEDQLEKQARSIENLSESLDKMKDSEQELKDLDQLRTTKEQLNYNDRKS